MEKKYILDKIILILYLLPLTLSIPSCSVFSTRIPDPIPIWSFGPRAIQIRYNAEKTLNFFNEKPHALVLLIYQLKNADAFSNLTKNEIGLKKLLREEHFDPSVVRVDKIIVQPPVYFPFFSAIKNNKRVQIDNQLVCKNGKYSIDFKDLDKKIDAKTRLLFLYHPHNPGGKSWSVKELIRLTEICLKKDVLIVSDEIHSDLILPGHKHIPTASISEESANRVITCIAPSKTFNIAGLGTSSVIISNPELRKKFDEIMEKIHIGMGNIFAITASIAAYTHGKTWLNEVIEYIQGNIDLVIDFCSSNIPKIIPMIPEATYLVWLNCKQLGLSDQELKKFMIEKVKVGFNDGPMFGAGGEGYQRMNVGCPRSVVKEALKRLEKAVKELT